MTAQAQVPSNFNGTTRRKIVQMPAMAKPTGGGLVSVALPKTGYVARIWLSIRGTIAGSITAPNPLGLAAILRRVRVTLNSGLDVYSTSGVGYHYLLRQAFDQSGIDPVAQSNARSAVAAGAYNLDMLIPLALNFRDPLGLLLLQSESTLVTLSVDFEADSALATGITTHTCSVVPYLEIFAVPPSATDQPPTNIVHQILEETQTVAATGQQTYVWPRGGVYLQLWHGLGFGVAGTDKFDRAQIRAAQSDFIQDTDTGYLDMEQRTLWGSARLAGTLPFDLYGTTALGIYDLMRDTIDTTRMTDISSVINATGTGLLYSLRRQLIVIPG